MWKNSKNMGISRQNILGHQQFLAKYFENVRQYKKFWTVLQ